MARRFTPIYALLLAAVAFAAVISGCGTTTDSDGNSGSAGETRSITFESGTSEVPVEPQRVVALGEEFLLADLLDLGVKPVASTATLGSSFSGIDPSRTEGIEPLDVALLDLDRVAALKPDLLLVDDFVLGQAGFDRLSKIAPTVAFQSGNWRENYELLARTLGEETEVKGRLGAYDDAVAKARSAVNPGLTASVMTAYPSEVVAWTADSPATVPSVLGDIGVELVPGPESGLGSLDSGRLSISLEKLDLLQGAGLIQLHSGSVPGENAALGKVEASPLYQGLPSVRSGQVETLDRLQWPGVTGRTAAAEQLGGMLSDWQPVGS